MQSPHLSFLILINKNEQRQRNTYRCTANNQGMGFNDAQATLALENTGHNGVELALEYLLNPPSVPQALPQQIKNQDTTIQDRENDRTNVQAQDFLCKMVLVIRTDLTMSPGKVAAQCCHAALECYKSMLLRHRCWLDSWERNGCTKITLKCPDESTLLRLENEAKERGLVGESIRDAGRTQIAAGSLTVLAIFGPVETVNEVTGKLELY